ncbi:MAG TPA: DNA methyltransferase [Anaerolineaceae bacterium]|nr:MAG: DNA methyltransferase [Chloroflexi bacterium GWB2_54_36]HAL16478.1 DNA methyltransferase [Anaerolineaceae bacterium]HBA90805.1 DNA methyltransferase [Anaerolineaceae bacterium]
MSSFLPHLENFAAEITKAFKIQANFNPEDQLKKPMLDLFEATGQLVQLQVKSVTEVQSDKIGRPDIGVSVKKLLVGHVELKAPGKGANPEKLKGRDKEQWERFRDLPNLIYTDGNEWNLFRNGEKIGKTVHFSGDVTADGKKAVDSQVAEGLFVILRDFLQWQPISPTSPKALAKLLAPICRLLRSDVSDALKDPNSNLSSLVNDWRKYLFPESDDNTFADAYAQTITYTLLLARLSGEKEITVPDAVQQLRAHHAFLSDVLKVLGDEQAQQGIEMPIQLLERLIAAVDLVALRRKDASDPWLYFYEDFLAEYDPKLRNDRGVYYTPVEVVQTQVRLVAELLEKKFGAQFSFADEKVITLDPATGTGTYLLAALEHALAEVEQVRGAGMRRSAATQAAKNMHGFEIMVGPYTVAHLRLMQAFDLENAEPPEDGVHIYLTDTLESPNAPPLEPPFMYKGWEQEHNRARKIKQTTPVLVCMGNPPYDRQQLDPEEVNVKRKGGWVRFGEQGGKPLLNDFLEPLTALGLGVHAKNLYNDYVYFWRWALWKVIENNKRGIVSFISAASYLRGPGFAAMRQQMREAFDDIWIIDLEGDNLGTRKSENVFQIQSPVAIAVCVRYEEQKQNPLAKVHYTRLEGTRAEKLAQLATIHSFADIQKLNKHGWRLCLPGKTDPFLPISQTDFWQFPLLTDLFPWQENGMQFKRTWVISESVEVLEKRWKILLASPNRATLFKETRDRKVGGVYQHLDGSGRKLPSLRNAENSTPLPNQSRIAYRSLDRQWAIVDSRFGDYLRPTMFQAHSDNQIYLTSLLTKVLGEGPSAIITALLPDMDHFCNRGAKDVIPLWQKAEVLTPNLTYGLIETLEKTYGKDVTPEDFFGYTYGVLFSPSYVQQFWDELTVPGLRLPITKDPALFDNTVQLGKRLIYLHTYGERFVPQGTKAGRVPSGTARCKAGTPASQKEYPEKYHYSEIAQELYVGKGVFNLVRPEVWNFSVSGLQVVKSWLGYRMKERSGKKSSALDDIRPETWTFDDELLDLLWVLDNTIDLLPEVNANFERILNSDLFKAEDFPKPTAAEKHSKTTLSLFDFAEIELEPEEE